MSLSADDIRLGTNDSWKEENVLLEVKDLSIIYKTDLETVYAVNGISFSLKPGETLGLVGETGAGKTTTALSIIQLLPERTGKITSGSIRFKGRELTGINEEKMLNIRGDQIAMIFQDPMTSLNPVMQIGEQIKEALILHMEDEGKEQDDQAIDARVDEVLSLVGISPDRKNDYPHQLSGGMKQRVVIAIALVCQPDLLIADEPTTALDVTIQAQVIAMMRDLRDRLGTAMIMITHDFGIIALTCDKVGVMYAGEIIEFGSLKEIFESKERHPYTTGLFGAIPSLNYQNKRLSPIDGLMPNPTDLPKGCVFSPRCPYCMSECVDEKPADITLGGTHVVRCHLFKNKEGGESLQ